MVERRGWGRRDGWRLGGRSRMVNWGKEQGRGEHIGATSGVESACGGTKSRAQEAARFSRGRGQGSGRGEQAELSGRRRRGGGRAQ